MKKRLQRALWLVAVPTLLAALTFAYGAPATKSGVSGPLAAWASLLNARPTLVLLGLFVCYAAVVRYWLELSPYARAWLPRGGEQAEPSSIKSALVWGASLLLAAAAALLLRYSFLQPYRVLSASMLPTLAPGDELLVNRSAYGLRLPFIEPTKLEVPRRGDLIVFAKDLGPGMPDELVKRVVGLPGDTVIVRAGQVWINGWAVPTCDAGRYAYLTSDGLLDARLVVEFLDDKAYLTAFFAAEDYGQHPYWVKPGEVFVLGDNRSNSSDSRFWNGGRGGGLELGAIRGRFDRRLVGVHRNGDADFSQLLKPIGLQVKLEGLDTSDLQTGVEQCLLRRPKATRPPPPFAEQEQKK